MMCMSGFEVSGSFCVVQSLWLMIRMVSVLGSSWTDFPCMPQKCNVGCTPKIKCGSMAMVHVRGW